MRIDIPITSTVEVSVYRVESGSPPYIIVQGLSHCHETDHPELVYL